MEKVLGQNEIDALFRTALGEAAPGHGQVAAVEAELFDFSNAGQISADQMRSIATVNDLFARNMMHTVGAWLRTEFQMTLVSGEQMRYSEYVERIQERNYVSSLRLEPLGAVGLLELDLALAAPIVDMLLGGQGQAEARMLTEIEELIMASVVEIVIKELNNAWQPLGLQFSSEKRESAAQVKRMMAAGEKTLCVCFEVQMPEATGVLNLCLPAVVLNTTLGTDAGAQKRPRRRQEEARTRLLELLGEAKVGSVLQFPPVRLSAREIATLAPGTVLRLPLPRHAAAELRVGGLSLGKARPVRTGEHRGARMEMAGQGSAPVTEQPLAEMRA